MIRKILVAFDTSEQSLKAFQFALEIAGRFGAEIDVVSVARPPEPPELVDATGAIEHAAELYRDHFRMLAEIAEAAGRTFTPHVRVGHPAEQILAAAEDAGADLIVMGHRGKSFVERWLLGSVSKRVLSYARCTVSIVR